MILTQFIPYIQNIPCFEFLETQNSLKQTFLTSKCTFWPQNLRFVSLIIFLQNFEKQFWCSIFRIYGIKRVSNFAKIQKSEYSAFCRALVLRARAGLVKKILDWNRFPLIFAEVGFLTNLPPRILKPKSGSNGSFYSLLAFFKSLNRQNCDY